MSARCFRKMALCIHFDTRMDPHKVSWPHTGPLTLLLLPHLSLELELLLRTQAVVLFVPWAPTSSQLAAVLQAE